MPSGKRNSDYLLSMEVKRVEAKTEESMGKDPAIAVGSTELLSPAAKGTGRADDQCRDKLLTRAEAKNKKSSVNLPAARTAANAESKEVPPTGAKFVGREHDQYCAESLEPSEINEEASVNQPAARTVGLAESKELLSAEAKTVERVDNQYCADSLERSESKGEASSINLSTSAVSPSVGGAHHEDSSSISQLTLAGKQPWPFTGRVLCRDDIREYSTTRGDGKLFEVWVTDARGGLIRFTIFNEAADKFYDILSPGSICCFSDGRIKKANPAFAPRGADVDISFGADADIITAPDAPTFASPDLDTQLLASLLLLSPKDVVTVAGIIKVVGGLKRVATKRGTNTAKREFVLVDDSNKKIWCTAWGLLARRIDESLSGHVVIVKDGIISDYAGLRSINMSVGTMLLHDPHFARSLQLRDWYEQIPVTHPFAPLNI
ncbi:hypothetical protein DVH05_017118 [Phytophthora capsici]|nr:hypothetical protein DVH05_017118 [Phytophthora capsici]